MEEWSRFLPELTSVMSMKEIEKIIVGVESLAMSCVLTHCCQQIYKSATYARSHDKSRLADSIQNNQTIQNTALPAVRKVTIPEHGTASR